MEDHTALGYLQPSADGFHASEEIRCYIEMDILWSIAHLNPPAR